MLLLEQLEYWHWWLLGVALITLEIFSPGIYLLWLGIAAGITGFVLLAVPDMSWQTQLVVFALFSVLAVITMHSALRHRPIKSDDTTLNRRGEQYIGRTFTLDEDMLNGWGKIHVDDSTWKVRGSNCSAGTTVKVTGVDGVVLLVEAQA